MQSDGAKAPVMREAGHNPAERMIQNEPSIIII